MTTIQRPGQRDGAIQLGTLDKTVIVTIISGIIAILGFCVRFEHRITVIEQSVMHATEKADAASERAERAVEAIERLPRVPEKPASAPGRSRRW